MSQLPAQDPAAVAGTRIPVQLKLFHRATFVAKHASFVLQLAKHLPAVFTVVAAGVGALHVEHDGGGRALAAAELLAGAWVLFIVGREAWHLYGRNTAGTFARPDSHTTPHEIPKVDSANLAAAALGFVEAWHRTHTSGHFKLWSPQTVGATMSLFLAFGGSSWLQKRGKKTPQIYVSVTPAGIAYKAGPRTSWRAEWTDVAAVEQTPGETAVRLKSGRRRTLRAIDFFDGEELLVETRAAIASYAPPHLAGTIGGASSVVPESQTGSSGGVGVQKSLSRE